MTRIITFYSFKGGVGRTMALVNVGHVMARDGWRVLLVDLDLEAPGMTHFLAKKADRRRRAAERDVVDLLLRVKDSIVDGSEQTNPPSDLSEYIVNIPLPEEWQSARTLATPYRVGRLDLIPATLESESGESRDYLTRIGELNLSWVFSENGPGHRFGERLREFLLGIRFEAPGDRLFCLRDPVLAAYDVILLDSRTGLNEIAGLCVGPVSDSIVVCTGLNAQNLAGTRYFARRVGLLNRDLGKPFVVVASPVPMWHSPRSSRRMTDIAKALGVAADAIVEIPYHPSAALTETVFVIEEPKDHITRAYEQLVPKLTVGIADEKGQKRIAHLTIADASSDQGPSEIAKQLSVVRLQDRPRWLRPRAIRFPTGFTLRGIPRPHGLGGIDDAARLALAAGVAALKLDSDEPFTLAGALIGKFDPEAAHDLRLRLFYYRIRLLGTSPAAPELRAVVASMNAVLAEKRDAPVMFSHELSGVLRIDAIVVGLLLAGIQYKHNDLPAEGHLRALLLPALETLAYSAISGMRTWLRAARMAPSAIINRYSTFLAHLFKPVLSLEEKQVVRKAVEEFRGLPRGRGVPASIAGEGIEYADDRRQDAMPLGMAPEAVMMSALALALTSPTVAEVLSWIEFARSTNGYSWRAMVDWRHLDTFRQMPTIDKYLRDEDAIADSIERRIDSGVYPL